MSARCSFDTEPWWALAITGAAPYDAPDCAISCAGGGPSVVDLHPGALGGDLVQPRGQPLGQAARVGEDDGRAVLPDQVGDVRLDVRPDGGARTALSSSRSPESSYSPGWVMSSTGTTTLRSHSFTDGRRDDLDRGRAAEEAGHLVERADGRRQPDALGRLREQGVEPLQAEAEVGAALGAGDRVHLVDDHGLDLAQALAGLAGEHQEQRLGRRDQDVGRRARQGAPLGRRGVSRADADGDVGQSACPSRSAVCRMPVSGARRLRSTSTASALSGEM